MKNWRSPGEPPGPPLHHADLRPCLTRIRIGDLSIIIAPGPTLHPVVHPTEKEPS